LKESRESRLIRSLVRKADPIAEGSWLHEIRLKVIRARKAADNILIDKIILSGNIIRN
jgi:hypothetical protein